MFDLELRSDPRVLPHVRQRLRTWLLERGWAEHQAGEVVLAVDEALSNVIRHGYGGRCNQRVLLSVAPLGPPDASTGVEVRVRDFSECVDLSQINGRPLDDVRPGGLGVHLIRAMMESVEYSHAPGGGLLLIMRKSKSHFAQTDVDGAAS